MAYTNIQLVRKKLADDYKFGSDSNLGDASTTIFQLSHGNIQDSTYTVFIDGVATTALTIDLERGIITFNTAPGLDSDLDVRYYFSAFSDTEITEFLDINDDNVDATIVELIEILLADASRRFDYSVGKTEMKPSQVFDNLLKLKEVFNNRVSDNETSESKSGLKHVSIQSPSYQTEARSTNDLSRFDEWD